MDKLPLVSIIITSYNRASTVWEAIESSLQQDYPNFEIIISDNCSTDSSDEVIKRYVNDPRVKYSRNTSNLGMRANFLKAICELASGQYFVIANSDDYFIANDFISKAIALTLKYDNLYIIKGAYKLWYSNSNNWSSSKYPCEREFMEGTQWLKDSKNIENFHNVINALGWGAIVVNRIEFLKLDELKFPIVQADVLSSVLLLLKGNIGFINQNVLVFRILNDRTADYTDNQIEICTKMLNVMDQIAVHDYNSSINVNLDDFYNRYRTYVIEHNLKLLYSHNKQQYYAFRHILLRKYPIIFNQITKTKAWMLFYVCYSNITLGNILRKIKNYKF